MDEKVSIRPIFTKYPECVREILAYVREMHEPYETLEGIARNLNTDIGFFERLKLIRELASSSCIQLNDNGQFIVNKSLDVFCLPPTVEEKIQAQRQYLDMLSSEYKKTSILTKIREGEIPKGEDSDLYNWLPYQEVWPKVFEPIYTRGILPNEIMIDPDVADWNTMRTGMTRILDLCKMEKIPYIECAYSGGRGFHLSFIIGEFDVPKNLEARIRESDVDYMKTTRVTLTKSLLRDAGVSPKLIGLDWSKINFSKNKKGSQIRCFGTTRKDGRYKTQVDPAALPINPPPPEQLLLRIPERICKWFITGTRYHNDVLKALTAECERRERASQYQDTEIGVDADLHTFPCIRYIMSNMECMSHGRYESAKTIFLLSKILGYSEEKATVTAYNILSQCQYLTPAELEIYVSHASTIYSDHYHFSCERVRDIVGSEGCNKSRCPLVAAFTKNAKLSDVDISAEPIPLEEWPPCVTNVLKEEFPPDNMLFFLAAFLGQVGVPRAASQEIFMQVSTDLEIFNNVYQKLKTPGCDKIRDMGHICTPKPRCVKLPSPRYYADKQANIIRLINRI